MTETQAKSGAAGATTQPTHGSARSETATPDTLSTTTPAGGDDRPDPKSATDSSTSVIRRSPSAATTAPGGATGGGPGSDGSSRPDSGSRASDPAKPLSFPPPPMPGTSAKASSSSPADASAGKPADESKSSPTTRISDPEPTVRTAPPSTTSSRTSTAAPVSSASAASAGSGSSSGTGSAGSASVGSASVGSESTSAGPSTRRSGSTGSAPVPMVGPSNPIGRAPVVAPKTDTRAGAASPTSTVRGAVTGAAAVGAARVSETLRSARATVAGAATRGPRRARLHLKRIDPWSVMKFSFAVSLVLFVVAVVATSVLYLALDAMNVFDSVNNAFAEITGQTASEATPFRITAKGVIGTSILLGAVNMVMFTALSTLAAFVYNVCADLVGGVEVTLSEKE